MDVEVPIEGTPERGPVSAGLARGDLLLDGGLDRHGPVLEPGIEAAGQGGEPHPAGGEGGDEETLAVDHSKSTTGS